MKIPWLSLVLIGCAALVGYLVTPPRTVEYLSYVRFIDAFICASIAVETWGIFHLLGCHRFSRSQAAACAVAAVFVWTFLVVSFVTALGNIDGRYPGGQPSIEKLSALYY